MLFITGCTVFLLAEFDLFFPAEFEYYGRAFKFRDRNAYDHLQNYFWQAGLIVRISL